MEYSHRDRRAQREVVRAFWAVVGVVFALIAFALFVPLPFAGVVGVVALGALGVACLSWSDRMLSTYSEDLRVTRNGTGSDGFLRAELATPIGLDRDVGRPTSRSPHTRPRNPSIPGRGEKPLASDAGDPPQV